MKNYGRLTAGLIAAWFILVLAASALHPFKSGSDRIGLAVALAALTPILLFSVWFATAEKFRQFTLSLSPQILTLAQSWRIIGSTFVLLQFIVWQELGILDLVVAVSLGTTAVWLSPHRASMVAMTVVPLSLIPTFLVPFLIFRARAWKAASGHAHQITRLVQA
jgi:hypothetical protein